MLDTRVIRKVKFRLPGVGMNPAFDVLLSNILHRGCSVVQCEAASIVLLNRDLAPPQRIVSGLVNGLKDLENYTGWRSSFLKEESHIFQLLDSPDRVASGAEIVSTRQTDVLGSGFTLILRLLRSEPFHILLLLRMKEVSDLPQTTYDRLSALSADCSMVFDHLRDKQLPATAGNEHAYLGESRPFRDLMARVKRVAAAANSPVLISGERGVGKEYIAWAIHHYSPRKNKPFQIVNSAALHHSVYAAELFGYRKGSFTGAEINREGYFRSAHGGTLFLDEVSEMPPAVHGALLRALEYGEIQSMGYDRPFRVDVRIVAATNRNLLQLVREEKFPADLYDRLNVLPIHVPPLRERKQDIPLLLSYFCKELCQDMQTDRAGARCFVCRETGWPTCSDAQLISQLSNYDWPGNIRELRNVVARLLIDSEGGRIPLQFLPNEIPASDLPMELNPHTDLRLTTVVSRHIDGVLRLTRGNKSSAARILGLPLSTLVSKMKALGIQSPKSTS